MLKIIFALLAFSLSPLLYAADEAKPASSANKIKDTSITKSTVNVAGGSVTNTTTNTTTNNTYVITPKSAPAKKSKVKKPKETATPKAKPEGDKNTQTIGTQQAEKIVNINEMNGNLNMGQ